MPPPASPPRGICLARITPILRIRATKLSRVFWQILAMPHLCRRNLSLVGIGVQDGLQTRQESFNSIKGLGSRWAAGLQLAVTDAASAAGGTGNCLSCSW